MDEIERMKENNEITKEVLRSLKMSLAIPDFSGIRGGVPVELAAKVLGKEVDYIKQGIREEWLPIGVYGIYTTNKGEEYYISPKLFWEFTGYTFRQNQKIDKSGAAKEADMLNGKAVSELFCVLKNIENVLFIIDQLLCANLLVMKSDDIHWNHYFFIMTSVDLCGYYLDSANGQLKNISDGQTDMGLVFFWTEKIKRVFDIISDALEVYMFPNTIRETINTCHDYLNQIDSFERLYGNKE